MNGAKPNPDTKIDQEADDISELSAEFIENVHYLQETSDIPSLSLIKGGKEVQTIRQLILDDLSGILKTIFINDLNPTRENAQLFQKEARVYLSGEGLRKFLDPLYRTAIQNNHDEAANTIQKLYSFLKIKFEFKYRLKKHKTEETKKAAKSDVTREEAMDVIDNQGGLELDRETRTTLGYSQMTPHGFAKGVGARKAYPVAGGGKKKKRKRRRRA